MVADAWALAVGDIPYLPLHHQLIVWAMSDKVTIPYLPRRLAQLQILEDEVSQTA